MGAENGAAAVKQLGNTSELSIESPYDPVIPLLGVHPKQWKKEVQMLAPMFIAAPFTAAKRWE